MYRIAIGDTLDSISSKIYGSAIFADLIAKANPGLPKFLPVGSTIVTPEVSSTDKARGGEGVQIAIDGQLFNFWTDLTVTQSIDSISVASFSTLFEPDSKGFKKCFAPFTYKKFKITIDGKPVFTGVVIGVTPNLTATARTLQVDGYSLPGVLSDCTSPASAYALEYDGQNLRSITADLITPFGIKLEFEGKNDTAFDVVASEPSSKVYDFIVKLAQQRNLVLCSTPEGALKIWQSADVSAPKVVLSEGLAPLLSVSCAFKAQEYYSHVTGIVPASTGEDGTQYTAKNPHLLGILRPLTFDVSDVVNQDITVAVKAKIGRMFGDNIAYRLGIAGWRDNKGALIAPNTTLRLYAPSVMIYNKYDFIIRSVIYKKTNAEETSELELLIPGAFAGKIPGKLPWDF